MDIYLTYYNSIWFYTLFLVHLHSDWDLPSRADVVFLNFGCYVNTQMCQICHLDLSCYDKSASLPPCIHLLFLTWFSEWIVVLYFLATPLFTASCSGFLWTLALHHDPCLTHHSIPNVHKTAPGSEEESIYFKSIQWVCKCAWNHPSHQMSSAVSCKISKWRSWKTIVHLPLCQDND